MKILVTGAFGGIGTEVMHEGHKKGHIMTAFEIDNKGNRKKAETFKNITEKIFWGDLRNYDDVKKAIYGQDIVIHLGAIVTPFSEKNPKVSDAVNIGGTKNIIDAVKFYGNKTGLIYTSSMSIMGADYSRKPPLKVTDPLIVSSNYTRQKIECEKILEKEDINYITLRLGAVINTDLAIGGGSVNQIFDEIFSMSLNNRIEGIWNIDAAAAIISAAEKLADNSVNRKIFFIGGGSENGWQMTVRDLYKGIFGAVGFGLPKDSCFSKDPYYADWLDTEESQKYFNYQNHSFENFIKAIKKKIGIKRFIFIIFSPFIKSFMSHKSKYSKK
ncbi:MAG: NAD(P)-dependent oxidoreductase [Thermotogae bacterium]|nr:NAD(P)-dependent oxidoreductase [Thermotogota bacterium]